MKMPIHAARGFVSCGKMNAVATRSRGALAPDPSRPRSSREKPVVSRIRLRQKRVCKLLACFLFVSLSHASEREELVFTGPPAVVSFPMIHMIESGALDAFADEIHWETWTNPDQLRVAVLQGGADFAAMPSNVVANLYNRGAPVRWLSVSTWGILWMVSRDPDKRRLSDFKGEEIVIPFRGDMPDLVFQAIAREEGLDLQKDFSVRYVANPLDAVQLLIARRARHALLAEPAVSMVLEKTSRGLTGLIAPDLNRSVTLQDEWGRVFERPTRMPQAGLAAIGEHDPELLAAVAAAYAESLAWCLANPEAAGELVARHIDRLTSEAVVRALKVSPMEAQSPAQAEAELRFFYEVLYRANPAIIGGKLPPDSFYQNAGQ